MMANCPKCGKLFARKNRPICDMCYKKDEECFEVARLFLKENPDTDMNTICEETGATKKQILRWVREGRLDLVLEEDFALTCNKCGKKIMSGRVCKQCASKLQSTLGGIQQPVDNTLKKKSNVIKVTDRRH